MTEIYTSELQDRLINAHLNEMIECELVDDATSRRILIAICRLPINSDMSVEPYDEDIEDELDMSDNQLVLNAIGYFGIR